MGVTLSTASSWTSARDDGQMKLELTPINENVLNSIVTFVENFPGSSVLCLFVYTKGQRVQILVFSHFALICLWHYMGFADGLL